MAMTRSHFVARPQSSQSIVVLNGSHVMSCSYQRSVGVFSSLSSRLAWLSVCAFWTAQFILLESKLFEIAQSGVHAHYLGYCLDR
jgi:hypothetical protein